MKALWVVGDFKTCLVSSFENLCLLEMHQFSYCSKENNFAQSKTVVFLDNSKEFHSRKEHTTSFSFKRSLSVKILDRYFSFIFVQLQNSL